MKIGLVDVDSHNFPNLPLMKISAYHKAQGDCVDWANGFERYDRVYMSKVFTSTPDDDFVYTADEIEIGGTGYDYENKLPPEIESICPDYELYPQYTAAYGFLTRGCPRNCGFCIVTKKEGIKSTQVADLTDFLRGQREIKLLDPNLLACKEREKLLQQLIDSRAYIDFTQGLDIRLTDATIAKMLNAMKIKRIHFAWDNPNEDLTPYFVNFKKYVNYDYVKLKAYVLTNYNSSHEQDLERIYKLRDLGFDPYVMIYDKDNAPRETRLLQRYVNNKFIFRTIDNFKDYNPKIG
jgi:hypothetical protein